MQEVLVDTDILSYYFRGDSNVVDQFKIYLQEFDQINISIITYYEILGGLKAKSANKQLSEFERFVDNNNIIHISEESARISSTIYSELRNKGISIGTSDILIAGVAMENDLVLVTNNLKHYSPISGLITANWKESS